MTAPWATVATAILLGGSAGPQQQLFQPAPILCFQTDLMRRSLGQRYGEGLLVTGLTNVNQLFELHASPDMATWTAILVLPQHIACTIASGRDLHLPQHRTQGKPA